MEIKINTLAIEFIFDAKLSGSKKTNFYRELYGHRSYSNYGKYTYVKEGVLSDIDYLKPTRSTLIVKRGDSKRLKDFFKKWNVVFDERLVFLDEKDAKKLGLIHIEGWKKIYDELKGNPNTFFKLDF